MPLRRNARRTLTGVNPAVLVPVKDFGAAKQRLAPVLTPDDRIRLARWMAERVLSAVAELAVFVACDSPEVRDWAEARGATVVWGPGLGLNGAVDDGVQRIGAAGHDHVIVAHADLPLPDRLPTVAARGVTTLIPDRRRDGTNVMSFPTGSPLRADYGAGSFARHLAAARRHHRHVEVRLDAHLSLDVDTSRELTHPLITEALPSWLPTIQANRHIHH